ncbi:MAG: kelch repeat-containing protein [Bacteroidia bacterium]
MKKHHLILLIFISSVQLTFASWQQKTSIPSDGRAISNIFVIGTSAYITGGVKAGNIYLNETWEYNTTNDGWTQKANIPANIGGGAAFSINSKGYVIMGWVNGANSNSVYEYDAGMNVWTTKNNFPGAPRYGSCVFVLNSKAYIGLGYSPLYSDLWQYDPVNDTWVQEANFPGGVREGTVHFALNGLGYVGCGLNSTATYAGLNDFYTYNDMNNTWTQIGNFPGPARHSAYSFVINNKAYVTCGNTGNAIGTTYNDLWQFDPQASIWTQLAPLPDTTRQSGAAFASGSCGYIFGGVNQPTQSIFPQLWQYCESTGVKENENSLLAEFELLPGKSEFLFKHSLNVTESSLNIISVDGKTIFSKRIIQRETKINLSQFPKGVYVWKFNMNNEILKTGKIVL